VETEESRRREIWWFKRERWWGDEGRFAGTLNIKFQTFTRGMRWEVRKGAGKGGPIL